MNLVPLMFIVAACVNIACGQTCKVTSMGEKSKTLFNQMLDRFNKFIADNDHVTQHRKLKDFLYEKQIPIWVTDETLPLETFTIKMAQYLDNEQSKLLSEMEKKFDGEITLLQTSIQESGIKRTVQLNELMVDLRQFFREQITSIVASVRTVCPECDTYAACPACPARVTCPTCPSTQAPKPFDCQDLLDVGEKRSGTYTIYPRGLYINVYCDMETAGGGWTTLLKRSEQTNQLNFTRNWAEYKSGFGDPAEELWLGLEALHLMTTHRKYSLRLEATSSGRNPPEIWGEYSRFSVDSEAEKFRLTLKGFEPASTMGHGYNLEINNGMPFTTIDRDNDLNPDLNCAESKANGEGGGFWYSLNCGYILPTSPFNRNYFRQWSKYDTKSQLGGISEISMKFRPIV